MEPSDGLDMIDKILNGGHIPLLGIMAYFLYKMWQQSIETANQMKDFFDLILQHHGQIHSLKARVDAIEENQDDVERRLNSRTHVTHDRRKSDHESHDVD